MENEKIKKERISRDELFTSIAELFGQRSTCLRAKVGCIAVIGGRIVSSGYVGAPAGQPHCTEEGCILRDGGCIRTVHAEANLVAFAARRGQSLDGAIVYATHSPCLPCAKTLANAGIEEYVWMTSYRDPSGLKLLVDVGVNVRLYAPES